jgi:hypothetical protein
MHSNLLELLSQIQKPDESITYKIRLTFGFYDLQTKYFQSCVPSEILSKIIKDSESLKGIRNYIPFVQELSVPNEHKTYCRVSPTMWDVCIDYVTAEQQAIFLNEQTNSFVVIVAPENVSKMVGTLHNILMTHAEVYATSLSQLYFCVV